MMINRSLGGFTLLESIAAIVITGIIFAAVAIFIQRPIQGYFSSTSRATMADTADTALRRIARDVQLALPNTVRVSANGMFIEYIPVKAGGRYQQNDACFSSGCSSLSTLGDMLNGVQIATGSDSVAIYNQYNNSGADCAPTTPGLYSAYCGQGTAVLTSASGAGTTSDTLGFANTVFLPPGGSPTSRVFIIYASPVTYTCDSSTNTLWRISGYALQAVQPTSLAAPPLSTATSVPLATNVSCPAAGAGVPPRFAYASGTSQRYALLSAWITLQNNGETVNLLHEIHVDNTP